jgi:pimeloyl-ACP methyl ester carboxylesterase
MPKFKSLKEVESYLKLVYSPYGSLSDREWLTMAVTSSRRCDDGSWTLHYDPSIITALSEHAQFQCWTRLGLSLHGSLSSYSYVLKLSHSFQGIQCPVLLLRGESSDVLPMRLAQTMQRHNHNTNVVVFPDCGHAPALNTPHQIKTVYDFLLSTPRAKPL